MITSPIYCAVCDCMIDSLDDNHRHSTKPYPNNCPYVTACRMADNPLDWGIALSQYAITLRLRDAEQLKFQFLLGRNIYIR